MARYGALLRGVNLGSHNKVKMADLRRVVEELEHTNVRTLVNSGNVVFDAAGRASAKEGDRLAGQLERVIKDELGVSCAVLVRTAAELAKVVDGNPYADEPDRKKVHVVFLRAASTGEERKAAQDTQAQAAAKGSRDELAFGERAVYLHTPDGFGRSVLAELLSRKKTSVTAVGTARNWSSVTKLLAMCQETTES